MPCLLSTVSSSSDLCIADAKSTSWIHFLFANPLVCCCSHVFFSPFTSTPYIALYSMHPTAATNKKINKHNSLFALLSVNSTLFVVDYSNSTKLINMLNQILLDDFLLRKLENHLTSNQNLQQRFDCCLFLKSCWK